MGALLTGVFAQKSLNGVADGLLFGNPQQVVIQFVAVAAVVVYSGAASYLLLKAIGLVIPLRTDAIAETTGLDLIHHGEEAYIHESGATASRGVLRVHRAQCHATRRAGDGVIAGPRDPR